MLSVIENAKNELVEKPVSSIGAIAALAALLIHTPEIVMVTPAQEAEAVVGYGKQGLVTWMLLYVSTCFLFGKFGSVIAKRNPVSGILMYPVLGLLAVVIGVYTASVYLSAYPLTTEIGKTSEDLKWFGMGLGSVAGLMAGVWSIVSVSAYMPGAEHESEMTGEDVVGAFMTGGIGVLFVGVMLGGLAYSLILGMVPVVSPS